MRGSTFSSLSSAQQRRTAHNSLEKSRTATAPWTGDTGTKSVPLVQRFQRIWL